MTRLQGPQPVMGRILDAKGLEYDAVIVVGVNDTFRETLFNRSCSIWQPRGPNTTCLFSGRETVPYPPFGERPWSCPASAIATSSAPAALLGVRSGSDRDGLSCKIPGCPNLPDQLRPVSSPPYPARRQVSVLLGSGDSSRIRLVVTSAPHFRLRCAYGTSMNPSPQAQCSAGMPSILASLA